MKETDSKSDEPCCVFPQTWLKGKEWGYEDLDREGDNYWGKYGSNNREVNIHMKRHICWSGASTSPLIFKNLWGTERTFSAATAHAFTLDVTTSSKMKRRGKECVVAAGLHDHRRKWLLPAGPCSPPAPAHWGLDREKIQRHYPGLSESLEGKTRFFSTNYVLQNFSSGLWSGIWM